MNIFDNYKDLYDEFLKNDCELEILSKNGLHYHYIISRANVQKDNVRNFYKKDRTDRPEKLKMKYFEEDINNLYPFVILVILIGPTGFYHQFTILCRVGLIEFIDPQPPIGNNIPNINMILKQYNSISNFITLLGHAHNLRVISINESYSHFREEYPPQYLENEILEHYGQDNILRGWAGGTCILWSTMIALEIYLDNITVTMWMNNFIKKFKDDPKSLYLINWLRHKLFNYLIECKKRLLKS